MEGKSCNDSERACLVWKDQYRQVGLWEAVRRCVRSARIRGAGMGAASPRALFFENGGGVMYGLKPVPFVHERKM
jgi:hypothetical protein